MNWQDGAVILTVGAAVVYVVRKFMAPRSGAKPVTFISIKQLKSSLHSGRSQPQHGGHHQSPRR